MKPTFLFLFVLIFVLPASAQKFTLGIENGVNFSNLKQTQSNPHFSSQPGPVNGMFVQFEPVRRLVLQSGVNHATHYFAGSSYHNYYPDYYLLTSSSYKPEITYSSIAPPSYNYNEATFSFLRIPLLVKFKTTGRLSAEFGGGAYYAILTNDEFRGKDKDIQTEEYRNEQFPPMHDWGWIVAGSLNYRIADRWNIFTAGQITTGHEIYLKNVEGKIGSTELTFGIGYKPFKKGTSLVQNDSIGKKIKIIPHSGINFSNTHATENIGEYLSTTGLTAGVSLSFLLGTNVSFLTGAWFEGKGYGLDYLGQNSFIYLPLKESENQKVPATTSEVNLDYLTFPFMLELAFGKTFRSNISFGAYYSWLQNAFSQGERIETYNFDQGYRVSKNYFTENLEQWFKKSDAGFMLGYRIEMQVFKWGSVFMAANQSFGAINIFEDSENTSSSPPYRSDNSMHNKSTSLIFGLTIPITQN